MSYGPVREQRCSDRAKVHLPGRWAAEGELPLAARITDLGPDGAFLRSGELPPLGTVVLLEFRLPFAGEHRIIWSYAQVRWRRSSGAGRGVGCAFSELQPTFRAVLSYYVCLARFGVAKRQQASFSRMSPTPRRGRQA